MINETFTQGPWKAHSVGDRLAMRYLRHMHPWSKDGECVAEIVHGAPDAHLIAAAPDMYEALDEIVNGHIVDGFGDYVIPSASDIMDMVKNALKKARGDA